MSLQERDWYREEGRRGWSLAAVAPKWTLIGITAAAFILQEAIGNGSREGQRFLDSHLALTLSGVMRGEVWQCATYALLHGGLYHLFWNMVVLYVFATILEDRLPAPLVWRLYALGAVGGGLGHVLWALARLPGGTSMVVGASGAVTALVVHAVLWRPSATVLLFLLPVPVWIVGVLFLGVDVARAVIDIATNQVTENVAVQAHLGGALAGALLWHLDRARRPAAAPRRSRREETDGGNVLQPVGPSAAEAAEEDRIDARVDSLLERIHDSGMASLTEEEREFLKRVSKRYGGRRG